MNFSTYDRDNDNSTGYNCASLRKGGWWYNECHKSNLNGQYANNRWSDGINWFAWMGFEYSLPEVRMMLRKPWYSLITSWRLCIRSGAVLYMHHMISIGKFWYSDNKLWHLFIGNIELYDKCNPHFRPKDRCVICPYNLTIVTKREQMVALYIICSLLL